MATFLARREAVRYKMSIKVEEVEGHPGSHTSLIDISPEGAQLETGYSLEKRELIEFSLPALENETVPIFSGRVAWIKKVSEDPERYRIGVCFINPFRGLSRLLFGSGG
ncbi:MAG: PilZ domain-containing protein, partial [Candidatus Margulisiibacteriota bacterium]